MQGNRPAGVLLVLAALLLVAFAAPAAAAYSGRVGATAHVAKGASWASAHVDTPALTRRIDDKVAPDLSWAANLLGANGIGYNGVDNADKPVCAPHCAEPGAPYTNDHCNKKYYNRC